MRALSICKSKLVRAGAALAISASFSPSEEFFFFPDKKYFVRHKDEGRARKGWEYFTMGMCELVRLILIQISKTLTP